jgi:hypothetical protein
VLELDVFELEVDVVAIAFVVEDSIDWMCDELMLSPTQRKPADAILAVDGR